MAKLEADLAENSRNPSSRSHHKAFSLEHSTEGANTVYHDTMEEHVQVIATETVLRLPCKLFGLAQPCAWQLC
jgi:hypothetical protein